MATKNLTEQMYNIVHIFIAILLLCSILSYRIYSYFTRFELTPGTFVTLTKYNSPIKTSIDNDLVFVLGTIQVDSRYPPESIPKYFEINGVNYSIRMGSDITFNPLGQYYIMSNSENTFPIQVYPDHRINFYTCTLFNIKENVWKGECL